MCRNLIADRILMNPATIVFGRREVYILEPLSGREVPIGFKLYKASA